MGDGIESRTVRESEIIRRRERHHPPDIDRGIRTEEESGWIHQKEVGVTESGGLDGSEDVGYVAPGHTAEDVGGVKAGVIEKVRDVVVGNIEVAEAVKQIDSSAWSCPARDVELGLAARENGGGHRRVEAGWRYHLGQGDRVRDGQKEKNTEYAA